MIKLYSKINCGLGPDYAWHIIWVPDVFIFQILHVLELLES